MSKFIIGVENRMQIDMVVARIDSEDEVVSKQLPMKIVNTAFALNLTKRPIGFNDKRLDDGREYYGWYISEYDYERILKLFDAYYTADLETFKNLSELK